MTVLASFHWAWLLASGVLGLLVGWISVARRSEGLSLRTMRWGAAILFVVVAVALSRLIPGRAGYWLDLFLVVGLVYVAGCVIGSWLRERTVARAQRGAMQSTSERGVNPADV